MANGDRQLLALGGACGVLAVLIYLGGQLLPSGWGFPVQAEWPATVLRFWSRPAFYVLGIISSYALYRLIGSERQGTANRLAFLFAVLAFTMGAAMVMVQDVVRLTITQRMAAAPEVEQEMYRVAFRALKGVDLGLDLVFDMFLGLAWMFWAAPMARHSRLGPWWAVPSGAVGAVILGLNAISVPWPPASPAAREMTGWSWLFDIGPFAGLFFFILSGYVMALGTRWRREDSPPAA